METNNYKISELAKNDLIEIFIFGISTFGLKQTEKYRNSLSELFIHLVNFPQSGISRIELGEGIQSFVYGSHIIYYSFRSNTLFIERILHQSVDVPNKFKK